MRKVGEEFMQASVGKIPQDKNRKKVQTRVGLINTYKLHNLAQSPSGFNASSYAQGMMCYIGQHLVIREGKRSCKNPYWCGFEPKAD